MPSLAARLEHPTTWRLCMTELSANSDCGIFRNQESLKTNILLSTDVVCFPKEVIDFPHTHNRCVDWWALGVLTFEILGGMSLFLLCHK